MIAIGIAINVIRRIGGGIITAFQWGSPSAKNWGQSTTENWG